LTQHAARAAGDTACCVKQVTDERRIAALARQIAHFSAGMGNKTLAIPG